MNIETYNIGDLIYYIKENKVHSADILSIKVVVNSGINVCTKEQHDLFERFGKDCIMYATCHGEFPHDEVYLSKEELLNSL